MNQNNPPRHNILQILIVIGIVLILVYAVLYLQTMRDIKKDIDSKMEKVDKCIDSAIELLDWSKTLAGG